MTDIDWVAALTAVPHDVLASVVGGGADDPERLLGQLRVAAVDHGALDPMTAVADAAEIRLHRFACVGPNVFEAASSDWGEDLTATVRAAARRLPASTHPQMAVAAIQACLDAEEELDDSYRSIEAAAHEAYELWVAAVIEGHVPADEAAAQLARWVEADPGFIWTAGKARMFAALGHLELDRYVRAQLGLGCTA